MHSMNGCAKELLLSGMYTLIKRPIGAATFGVNVSSFASHAPCWNNSNIRESSTSTIISTRNNISTRQPSFFHKDLKICRATPSQMHEKPDPNEHLIFGHRFTDHMVKIHWTEDDGWSHPLICPIENLQLHPASKVFHYSVQLFEGMKAFRCHNDEIILFRPEKNLERMNRSAVRAALPEFSVGEMLKIISELVSLERDWIPKSPGSLYVRPTYVGIDPVLGVSHPNTALLYVITCPVGQYYPTGFKPVTLYANPKFCRAFPGGVGNVKMGCNYGPTMMVSKIAQDMGCQQVLWLFGNDRVITEAGSMNIFIFWKTENGEDELVTAPLDDGIILPGIVRDSLLHLARVENKFKVSERYVTMDELKKAIKEKRMYEMFGTGTACVVSPVDRIMYKSGESDDVELLEIPTMKHQPNLMQKFYDHVLSIYNGISKHPEWTVSVK